MVPADKEVDDGPFRFIGGADWYRDAQVEPNTRHDARDEDGYALGAS
jgi:hypothetical protein